MARCFPPDRPDTLKLYSTSGPVPTFIQSLAADNYVQYYCDALDCDSASKELVRLALLFFSFVVSPSSRRMSTTPARMPCGSLSGSSCLCCSSSTTPSTPSTIGSRASCHPVWITHYCPSTREATITDDLRSNRRRRPEAERQRVASAAGSALARVFGTLRARGQQSS